jgi:hypothetical protein
VNGEPLSPITDDAIAAYDRDGVVRLHGAIQRDIEASCTARR